MIRMDRMDDGFSVPICDDPKVLNEIYGASMFANSHIFPSVRPALIGAGESVKRSATIINLLT
ncbi:hypothetical protein RUM43_005307 [Polyplax serrata]|uniref:Uncharacterized protein n=1 Tax=Polyplax serrata TaxID=468196 RepID=A0AAN8RUK8_POLSC